MKTTDEPRLLPVTPQEMKAAIETVDAGNAEVEACKAYLADMCRAFSGQKGTP